MTHRKFPEKNNNSKTKQKIAYIKNKGKTKTFNLALCTARTSIEHFNICMKSLQMDLKKQLFFFDTVETRSQTNQ